MAETRRVAGVVDRDNRVGGLLLRMADTKEGREKQAQDEETRQRERALDEALDRADEAEPETAEEAEADEAEAGEADADETEAAEEVEADEDDVDADGAEQADATDQGTTTGS